MSHAVHAGIGMADALSVFYLGRRSASQDHRGALRLLEEVALPPAELGPPARHLASLLAAKTRAEYEERLLGRGDAEDAVRHAERFCAWARGKLPP